MKNNVDSENSFLIKQSKKAYQDSVYKTISTENETSETLNDLLKTNKFDTEKLNESNSRASDQTMNSKTSDSEDSNSIKQDNQNSIIKTIEEETIKK